MNSLLAPHPTIDAHEKTIDLRIERLREAISHANAIHTSAEPQLAHANRTVTVLAENRVFLSAHTQLLIERVISAVGVADQDQMLAAHVRPLTLLLEEASIAIARMRQIIGERQ